MIFVQLQALPTSRVSFWLLKTLRGPSKLNRGVLGSRRPNSPSWTILAGEQLEAPNPAVPLALVVNQPSPVGLLPGRPRPCAPPFPTAPPPFRPRSASVPDDPSPGRPPPPPPRAGAASRASGVAESASSRRCGENGTRQDRAGGPWRKRPAAPRTPTRAGVRRRRHGPSAGRAGTRVPGLLSGLRGGPGRLGRKARGGGPESVCAQRRQTLPLLRSGVYSFYEETTAAYSVFLASYFANNYPF